MSRIRSWMTQIRWSYKSLVLESGMPEVEQQSTPQIARCEVVDHLAFFAPCQAIDCLELHENRPETDKICAIPNTQLDSFVVDR